MEGNSKAQRFICIQFNRVFQSYSIFCRSNQYGTPYLKAMFQFAFDHFNSEFYGYVNADILLDNTLIDSLHAISRDIKHSRIGDRLYIVGQRTNVQQELEDRYSPTRQSSSSFVVEMVLKGHRYWDSAVVGSRKKYDPRITTSLHETRLIGRVCPTL